MSGETIFITTGKPICAPSFAASAALVATPSPGTAMPYASQTCLPSGAVSDVRPDALTASRSLRTFALSLLMSSPLSVIRSDDLGFAQRGDVLRRVAELGEDFLV